MTRLGKYLIGLIVRDRLAVGDRIFWRLPQTSVDLTRKSLGTFRLYQYDENPLVSIALGTSLGWLLCRVASERRHSQKHRISGWPLPLAKLSASGLPGVTDMPKKFLMSLFMAALLGIGAVASGQWAEPANDCCEGRSEGTATRTVLKEGPKSGPDPGKMVNACVKLSAFCVYTLMSAVK
jgi:hypothetical protein